MGEDDAAAAADRRDDIALTRQLLLVQGWRSEECRLDDGMLPTVGRCRKLLVVDVVDMDEVDWGGSTAKASTCIFELVGKKHIKMAILW